MNQQIKYRAFRKRNIESGKVLLGWWSERVNYAEMVF